MRCESEQKAGECQSIEKNHDFIHHIYIYIYIVYKVIQ